MKRPLIAEPIGLDLEGLSRPLDWAGVFGNRHPVELELGFGKGNFLTEQAKTRPETNFFGVEWARGLWRYASDRLRRSGCRNVRTVRAEAGRFVREWVPPGSLAAVHIYFPDPWPKRRHHKRRLLQAAFLGELERILGPGGMVHFVTDHLPYFEAAEALLRGSALEPLAFQRAAGSRGELVGTNFERIFRREGKPVYALSAVRLAHNLKNSGSCPASEK